MEPMIQEFMGLICAELECEVDGILARLKPKLEMELAVAYRAQDLSKFGILSAMVYALENDEGAISAIKAKVRASLGVQSLIDVPAEDDTPTTFQAM